MTLADYLEKYANRMGHLETIFLRDVYYRDYGEKGLDYITPEVEIERNDGSGRKWRIDFVITTKMRKYAIECDGYNYHAAGAISRDRFDELESKKNETVFQGYTPVSLSRDQITQNPQDSIYQLRRMFNADPDLYNIFLCRLGDSITPHEIQVQALEALSNTRKEGHKRGLVVLATGLGKTYLSAFDARAIKASSVLFIVHVEHILKQAKNSFEDVMPNLSKDAGFFTGKEKDALKKRVVFSTIQTLTKDKNLKEFSPDQFDYIVMDETHHAAAPTYIKITEYFKPKFFLGLTATPERMDGQDILKYYEDNLVFQMNQSEAIKQGYLASLIYKGFKDNVDYSGIYYNGSRYDIDDLNKSLMIERRDEAVIEKFKELAADKKTIGFCVSIDHADWCAKRFQEAGINAIAIHSQIKGRVGQEYQTAEEILKAFDGNKYQVAFVVDMLNEGIDIPDVECLLMLRPTESNAILTQQIGRGLRISPGKDGLLVLDFIGNYQTSPRILDSLGIKNLSELKEDREKQIYYYENEGRRVEFQSEVVDIFRYMLSKSSKKVRESLIGDDWKEYGDYVEENTKQGNSLFWSVGKKNNSVPVHIWALKFLSDNSNKYKTNDELSKALNDESKKVFPEKTMEGIRALFFSKLVGLLKSTNPIELSDAYKNILLSNNISTQNVAISNQLEKIYYWNDTFSLINRHEVSGHGRVRKVNEIFHIYPLFFVYDVIIRLNEMGYDPVLTRFEINTFVLFARSHKEVIDVVDRIVNYRAYEEKYELEKYLNSKMTMDARFFKILQYSQYFIYNPDRISLKPELIDELTEKVNAFNILINDDKLIHFNSINPASYRALLYSEKGLIEYHKN